MATASSELQAPALSEENRETLTEKTKEEKQPDIDTDEPGVSSVDALLNMEVRVAECGQDGEEGDVKPAAEADEEAAEAVVVTAATTVAAATGVADDDDDEEKTVGCKLVKTDENCSDSTKQSSLVDGGETSETVKDTVKEIESKPEEQREESQSPVTVSDCVVKSKVRDDAPEPGEEKTSTRGGDREELAVEDKRGASVEMSSSDGEPLSRMDSEDSSTLMDMESTVSSGRSTPAMMNGQSSAAQCHSSTKGQAVGNSCCWDQCGLCFTCSPDLAEHIRGVHVDGQRGGVGSVRNQDKIGLCSFGRKPFETE
ncbi:zinc finger protein AEBP2-like isoform X2 [Salvelinus alpinus]|uniref:zinc finger protein AEBP2-like isoform X2 n=1 Tax=Salvelinus alpinus TaxID=8036 RepID=UPI0039FCAF9E